VPVTNESMRVSAHLVAERNKGFCKGAEDILKDMAIALARLTGNSRLALISEHGWSMSKDRLTDEVKLEVVY